MPIDPHAVLRQTLLATAATKSLNDLSESLVSMALQRGEGASSASGALAVNTGKFTGRSPKDKFIVRDGLTEGSVWWTNSAPLAPEHFDMLLADAVDSLSGKALFVQDLVAGADPAHAMGVSIYTETAWHALFIRNLLIRPEPGTFPGTSVTIVHAPYFSADPDRHGTRTSTAIALDMRRKIVVIAGTLYAGEIKKSVFSLFNFHAPKQDVLPMHCSANLGQAGDVALFFGLSGTGKTTLSTDPKRPLIGDDEHGWTHQGVFNLEGGCYAKTAKLNQKAEPEIFAAVQRPGTVLENVVLGENGMPDFDDLSRTENTRAAYPIEALPAIARGGVGGAPRTVVFLTADAFGVLPPIARLSPEQAVYHFLSGYTAKVAGTERGVTEPEATFSACFGAPFMPLHPRVYGAMLKTRLKESGAATYLLNTGWTGGPYGVGRRIDIATTRRLLDAALSGMLEEVEMRIDSAFGFAVPVSVPGIDAALLDPRRSWADKAAYDRAAENLVGMFIRNFGKFGEDARAEAAAGPSLVAAE